jgi:hypothetical protein
MTGDREVAARPGGWIGVLLGLRFLIELALAAGLAWLAAAAGPGGVVSVLLAVAAVVVIGVFWTVLMAPRARRRLAGPVRLVVELVLFAGTSAGLIAVGHPVPAIVGGVIAIVAALLARRFAPEP